MLSLHTFIGIMYSAQIFELLDRLDIITELAGSDITPEGTFEKYATGYGRQPDEDDSFYIKCFTNVNSALLKV